MLPPKMLHIQGDPASSQLREFMHMGLADQVLIFGSQVLL
jgi:hypothetical protein